MTRQVVRRLTVPLPDGSGTYDGSEGPPIGADVIKAGKTKTKKREIEKL